MDVGLSGLCGPGPEAVFTQAQAVLCVLTSRLLADDAMRAVSAGSRLPQAAVALDPEAGVRRQHR